VTIASIQLKKALNGLDGVTSSEVSLANGNVEVEFDENQVAFNDFKRSCIEDQGYDVIK
jgi:copper chaperone